MLEPRRTSKFPSRLRSPRYLKLIGILALGCGASPTKHAEEDSKEDSKEHHAPEERAQRVRESAASHSTLRYLGQAKAQLSPGYHWTPILEAASGLSGQLIFLAATAPLEAPGPRLTLLRMDNSGPEDTLVPSDELRHPFIVSQPTLDNRTSLEEVRRFIAAPKTRTTYALTPGCDSLTPAQAFASLSAAVATLQHTQAPAPARVDALASILVMTSLDIALSPPHLRRMLTAIGQGGAPTIAQQSARRATVQTPQGQWSLVRRACWTVGAFTPASPHPPR
ncbi:MAG: hypothetical protein ACPHRO_06750 [Nannocystaceae bacterium]